ncbi:MAG: hypothetical protein EBS96_12155, partial [Spartobacteria bacterium]|nr:hypothetical protein [Spartobacteria bacterium]
PGNDAEAAEKFKQELGAKLEALPIADQAGFHFREGEERLREGVHIVPLPPYSPELNSCEQLWDVLKDVEGFPMVCLNR